MTDSRANTHPMLDVSAWEDATPDASLMVADGPSVTVSLRDGCLIVKDGPRGSERERVIAKVPRIVKRLMILSGHGYISLDAQRWLDDRQITWAVIERNGPMVRTLATSGRHVDIRLMRRQALCAPGGPLADRGVRIVQRFMKSKLEGQAWNARNLLAAPEVASYIEGRLVEVMNDDDLERIGGYEGQAGAAYWSAWKGYPLRWKKPAPIKAHWQAFPKRNSLRRDYETNRGATDPANAMLNFGYHIAEVECTLALYGSALNPAMGIDHVDRPGRDSFSLDVLEAFRPHVDQIVLSLLGESLDKRMFREDSEGMLQVTSPLTHRIVSEVRKRALYILPDVHYVVNTLQEPLTSV